MRSTDITVPSAPARPWALPTQDSLSATGVWRQVHISRGFLWELQAEG